MVRRLLVVVLLIVASHASHAAAAVGAAGTVFPNLKLSSLDGLSQVELQSFHGRPVLLTFWASWCAPCRTELPELERLYGEMVGHGLVVLTVSVDQAPAAAERFVAQTRLRLPVYRLGLEVLRELGIQAIPTSILIDQEGAVTRVFNGYTPSLPSEVRAMVTAPPATTEGSSQ